MLNGKLLSQLLAGGVERLPHAMLLVGAPGVGRSVFAEQLAALLLCESRLSTLLACGKCQGCHWQATANHPDFRRVAPESADETEEGVSEKAKKKSTNIRIEQIRELEEFVFVGSHRNGHRVVLITDADVMLPAAANALLKILEEPPPSVYFILISSKQRALLPTLRSRCRVIPFGAPEKPEALAWLTEMGLDKSTARYLDLAGGAPARVKQWQEQGLLPVHDALIESMISPAGDPIVLASRWDSLLKSDSSFRMEHLVDGVQRWLFDLAQESASGRVRYHGGWPRPKGANTLNSTALLAAWREIAQIRRSARHPLNQLLLLETLAAYFLRAIRPTGATSA